MNPWKSTTTKVDNIMTNSSNNKIRLIAVDLDGTLFNSDHRVSETTQTVLQQTLASGMQVILATGRNRTFVNDLLHQLDLDIPYICSGGAMLISGRDGEVLYSKILQLNGQLPAVISWAESHQTCLLTEYADGRMRWYSTTEFLDKLTPGIRAEFPIQDYSQNPLIDFAVPAVKICFLQMGESVASAAELERVFPDFQFVYSGYNCQDLTALGVDKGNALAFYAEQHGYSQDEIAAIGDQTNDISMLRYAGLSFAMGGAPEEVKLAAQFIAPSNDDDGAAWVMQNIHSFSENH
jgi:Cof subfamily protein (haloacid dehalogenase superfamily)